MLRNAIRTGVGVTAALLLTTGAHAGHRFDQGSTNTPVWLQEGQAVFIEQFYSDEDGENPGEFWDIDFGPANTIPTGADTSNASWSDFDAGDVLEISIGDLSLTLAYDGDVSACAYDYCGWRGGSSFAPGDAAIPSYTTASSYNLGWGNTILPALDVFDGNGDSQLSLAELRAASPDQLGSARYYFYVDIGLTTYDTGDDNSSDGITLDTDGSGTLSAAEVTAFDTAMNSRNYLMEFVNDNFSQVDLDSSGELSQAELDAFTSEVGFELIDSIVDSSNQLAPGDGVLTADELFEAIWLQSRDMFHTNSDGTEGLFNDFGLTFTAVAGQFSLESYRIADAGGWNLHGAGSGPVSQDTVCIPPNCGPGNAAPNAQATAIVIAEQHMVERAAMKQAEAVLVGVSELQVDVNFSGGQPSNSTVMSSRGGSMIDDHYRWAARVDGSFSDNDDLGQTNTGSFVIAYALTADTDVGFYAARRTADLALGSSAFDGTINAYGLYVRNREDSGLGAQWKISVAGSNGDATLTRIETTGGAEAATGVADLTGQTASVEIGYGLDVQDMLVTPYGRLAFAKMSRGAYTEGTSATSPLSYSEYTQKSTTLTLGVSAELEIDDVNTVVSSVRAIRDLDRSSTGQAGASSIVGLTEWNLSTEDQLNPTRFGVDVTIYHKVSDNSRVYSGLTAQKEANVDASTVAFNFGFETRF